MEEVALETNLLQLARAFELGARDAYIHFPRWCDDLERRMMTDWVEQTEGDGVSWLEVREAAFQSWQERQEALAAARLAEAAPESDDGEPDSLLIRAQLF